MIDFTLLKETILIFWDTPENFSSPKTQLRLGKKTFKQIIQINSLEDLTAIFEKCSDDEQKFLFAVHLDHGNDKSGYYSLRDAQVQSKYPNLTPIYVSSAPKSSIYENGEESELVVYSYTNLQDNIGSLYRRTKWEILGAPTSTSGQIKKHLDINIDYGIITALYDDEFEAVEQEFDWLPESEHYTTGSIWFKIGHLKGRPDKKIVATNLTATGMVDAGIVSSIMLEHFKPKYIFMSGVCGGLPDYNFGSIIVASSVFAFQKGKISDVLGKDGKTPTKVNTRAGESIDLQDLYDESGENLSVAIEKFSVEHDSMPDLDPLIHQKLQAKAKTIEQRINKAYSGQEDQEISITMAPMACSTMVVDRKGYFQDNIKGINRKVLAVEMEGYGVARACRFANNGQTKWVIFKAIMDNTTQKNDKWKKKAAYTSAQFLLHILQDDIL
jgi:nucleoside phosphorylase